MTKTKVEREMINGLIEKTGLGIREMIEVERDEMIEAVTGKMIEGATE